MKEEVVVVLDVGGTTLTAGLVTRDAELIHESDPVGSRSDSRAEIVVGNFAGVINAGIEYARQHDLIPIAVGIAMPNPFDYELGVSRMEHKFHSLYNVNVKEPLETALNLPVFFINDADAFALGAWWGEHRDEARFLGITLGTGLGSGFIVDGEVVTEGEGIPADGEIWEFLYDGGELEEVVTKEGLERAYVAKTHGVEAGTSVERIAKRARAGDEAALAAFGDLAVALGEGLAAAAGEFHATHIVLGGQISKASDLFLAEAQAVYSEEVGEDVPFSALPQSEPALLGAARHAFAKLEQ